MNKHKKLKLAHWVVTEAKKNGADALAVNITNSRDIEVSFRDGQLEELKESTQNSLSLTVYAKNRYSSHSTNDLNQARLEPFVSEAVAMTAYLSKDPFRSLPDPKHYADRKDVDLRIYDDSYEGLTSEERVKYAQAAEAAAQGGSDRVISCTSGFSDSFFETVKVHSNGFEGVRRGTSFSAGAEVTVNDDGGGRPQDWDWRTVRFRKDLPKPEVLGKTATERALGKIGQVKMKSGRFDMIVTARAGSRMLNVLYGPMQASALQQKRSFLDGKLGQKIGSDKLTMVDDPFIETGIGSRLYDGDGMATKRRVMIDKGVLKSYYIDWYYGQKLGLEPTTGGSTNLVFEYGDQSLDELVKGMKKGILINTFIGGNSNSTTGDFSYGIMGLYIEDGRVVQPVNEMNISGNAVDMWNQLVAMGNDPWTYSSWRRPSMYFTDIQFSGI